MTIASVLEEARERAEAFTRWAVKDLYLQFSEDEGCCPDPIHGIGYRIKTAAAIQAKLASHDDQRHARSINDYIGIRILAMHSGCLEDVERRVGVWAKRLGLFSVRRQDRFEEPGLGGYRSIHIDYAIEDPGRLNLPPEATLECQLTTWLQHLHGRLSHELVYKTDGQHLSDRLDGLASLSAHLFALDSTIASLTQEADHPSADNS